MLSTYPSNCWASPFTRGGVWGIDEGWATAARTSVGPNLSVNEGSNYELTVSIAEPYRTALGIPAEDASVTVPATVVQGGGDDHHGQRKGGCPHTVRASSDANRGDADHRSAGLGAA